ncbi:MAG: hypothetical protein ABIF11_11655 [Nitrospirota bacterium]
MKIEKNKNVGWCTGHGNFYNIYEVLEEEKILIASVYIGNKPYDKLIESIPTMFSLLLESWDYLINEKQLTNCDIAVKIDNFLTTIQRECNIDTQ